MSAHSTSVPVTKPSPGNKARRWWMLASALAVCTRALAQQPLSLESDGLETNRVNQLAGALEIVSPINAPNSGEAGADVEAILINPATYTIGVGASADASQILFYSGGGAANPWTSGILAASFGAEGVDQGKLRRPSLNNGGNGGTVTIDTTGFLNPSDVNIVLSGFGTPALTGELTLNGVYALSQGGQNSLAFDSSGINSGSYSDSGNGGLVNVDFFGQISDIGEFSSSAGPLISNAVGISAISRGGIFKCWDNSCDGRNYPDDTYNTPGAGGDVTVTLHSGSTIILDSGSATGIYAASMNGGILSEAAGSPYNVNTSTQSAGTVTVNVDSGATINVGGGAALEAYGVLALSAGSELELPLQYQNSSKSFVNLGGAAYGGAVSITNGGDISASGVLAMGLIGMNVGGEAAVGLLGVDQGGVYDPNKNRDRYQLTPQILGDIDVNNTGTISVNGETSFGILAVSLGRGFVFHTPSDWLSTDLLDPEGDFDNDGLSNRDDLDDDNDGLADYLDPDDNNNGINDYPCVANPEPSGFPICNGSESGLVIGNTNSDTATSGGDINVQNSGVIAVGQSLQDNAFALGIVALSVGGGGATGSGGLGIFAGDNGGAGGDGGTVTVENSGDIATAGDFSQAILASSIGGGGGVGGSNTMPFVAVGGNAGSGGHGGDVSVNLSGVGTITTTGNFSDAVLAQSIGGGGGTGGSGTAWGLEATVAVGGKGGNGGNGGAVSIVANNNDDPLRQSVATLPTLSEVSGNDFEIATRGAHAAGLLAQSIGGGGGSSGNATSESLNVIGGLNINVGRNGPGGGEGGEVAVQSDIDILVVGDNARGIVAHSIGGGGGKGGAATNQAIDVEVPLGEIPNGFANLSLGGIGGDGGNSNQVTIGNGGLVVTAGDSAIGILGQSIAGGGGDAGAVSTWNRFANLPVPSEGWGFQLEIGIGRSGGDGGDAGSVALTNGLANSDTLGANNAQGGAVLTLADNSAGLVAQSIGGGGGTGGSGDISSAKSFWYEVATLLEPLIFGSKPFENIDLDIAAGGSGGGAGNGGSVSVVNGILDATTGGYQPGVVITEGGNSQGLIAQSIGGGGGLAAGGSLHNTGGKLNLGLAMGGSGGAAGNGSSVNVINPTGGFIRTGEVVVEASTEAEMAEGASPYTMITRGGGSVGILAQSIGGGGGAGGNADASSTLPDGWKGDVKVGMAYFKKASSFLGKAAEENVTGWRKFWKHLEITMNVAIAGSGGAAGTGGDVNVANDGSIETFGDQAHGIHAQSIGGGGGTGGSVEAEPVTWQTLAAAPTELGRLSIGVTIGGDGGEGNHGGVVAVSHDANGVILTHGYGANGIFAQSVGGGGGYAGVAATNSEGSLFVGYNQQGDGGPGGMGEAVSVTSAGVIETIGDDANGILAQSIGGGGGAVAAGCTNSEVKPVQFHVASWGQSPCWGNAESEDGLSGSETTQSDESDAPESNRGALLSLSVNIGGTPGDSDRGMDGGVVDIAVSNRITTHGSRSMGVIAQSIGGGGGYSSQDATAYAETLVSPGAGSNHSHGSDVTVALTDQAAIETYGNGAWGVLAQSIGGGGGFVGDSSLYLGMMASNTVSNVCCGDYSTGSDGGNIAITLGTGTSIVTQGRNAHGIVAQSIGGGGGIAAGWDNDPDAFLYMGNPQASEWSAPDLPEITWTGQGGTIAIDIEPQATVAVYGAGSFGILAQSSGNSAFQSPIQITVDGSVYAGGTTPNDAGSSNAVDRAIAAGSTDFSCGGCMNTAAIVVSGGTSSLAGGNGHNDNPNQITVGSTGRVGVADLNYSAIYATYGHTNVSISGIVYGGIVLGDSITDPGLAANLGDVIVETGGHWTPGTWNLVANSSIHNHGTLNIVGPTLINGSLRHYADGVMHVNLDPSANGAEYALQVSGQLTLEGVIAPVMQSLLPGELQLANAGTLEGDPILIDPEVFDWQVIKTGEGGIHLSAHADFTPSNVALQRNKTRVADYLQEGWAIGDASMAELFGHMLYLESGDQYRDLLTRISAPEVLHQELTTLRDMPTLLNGVIDCPRSAGISVLADKESCTWLQAGFRDGHYSGSDTSAVDIDSTLFAIGFQRQVQPGWFVGGVFGRSQADIDGVDFGSDGHTDIGAVGIKHNTGPWSLGAAIAYGSGSFSNLRSFTIPSTGMLQSAPSSLMRSRSALDVVALQAQATYTLSGDGWYLRPELAVALFYLDRAGFVEEASIEEHLLALWASGQTETAYTATPQLEWGTHLPLTADTSLNIYARAGVRVAPWDSDVQMRFEGVSEDSGWFTNAIDDPLFATVVNIGAQLLSKGALDLSVEYSREDNGDFSLESAAARLNWQF